MTFRHGYAAANELKLHYATTGAEDAPFALFLHGFPEFWRMWQKPMLVLGDRLRCVAPDLPGYNLSSKPQDVARYRTKALVDDVADFAGAFTKGKFTLVAHDWGGALAWAFAIKHPEMLERLIIVNAVHPATFQREVARNPAQANASQYILDIRAEGSEARFAENDFALLRRSFAQVEAGGLLSDEDKAAYRAAWSEPGALTGMFNWYRAMKMSPPKTGGETAPPRTESYDAGALTVRVPTLVLWGEKDTSLLPGCIDGLEDFVPGVIVKRFPQGSHWLVHEEPDAVAREIADFCGVGA